MTAPCPIIETLREKLRSRSEAGIRKYGVNLARTDLSRLQWMMHLQEELLDAAGYLEVLIQRESDEGIPMNRDTQSGKPLGDAFVADCMDQAAAGAPVAFHSRIDGLLIPERRAVKSVDWLNNSGYSVGNEPQ